MDLHTEIYIDKGNGLNENDKLYIDKNVQNNGDEIVYDEFLI